MKETWKDIQEKKQENIKVIVEKNSRDLLSMNT
jgi:hypothetical protein